MSLGNPSEWQVGSSSTDRSDGIGGPTLASPQLRTNLSPFTKDFRVEVQLNESIDSFLGCPGDFVGWGDLILTN